MESVIVESQKSCCITLSVWHGNLKDMKVLGATLLCR